MEYDLIQRIRVVDGIPAVISTHIKVIDSEDLLSIALDYLKKHNLSPIFKKEYIGVKEGKRYTLVLIPRKDKSLIIVSKTGEKFNKLFPYLKEIHCKDKQQLLDILQQI